MLTSEAAAIDTRTAKPKPRRDRSGANLVTDTQSKPVQEIYLMEPKRRAPPKRPQFSYTVT
jgi:hypothetical protein